MSCCQFIGNKPPGGGGDGGGVGTPDVFFRVTKTTPAQTLQDDTEETIVFNNVDYNQGAFFIPSSTGRPPVDGLYLFEATLDLTFQAAGYYRAFFDVGGGGAISEERHPIAGAGQHVVNIAALIHLVQFSLVQVRVRQVTGLTATASTGITRFNGAQLRVGSIPGGG